MTLRIVVAGATGFIGRRTAAALVEAGHTVADLPRAEIAAILDGGRGGAADVLVWAAGSRQPDRAANVQLHATAPVACARALGVRHAVYLSSGEVYGAAPLPYREDGPVLGTSDYAAGKLAGETELAAVVSTASLRLGLVYGPGCKPPMLIPRVVAALRAAEHVALTHGQQTRDLVFVDDVARAVVRAVEAAAAATFNIASGTEVRIRDVVEALARALGADAGLLGFGEVAVRPDEALRYVLDVTRARDVLGWTATTPLAEGLARL
jgi:UDP-glucose 4-epimerase